MLCDVDKQIRRQRLAAHCVLLQRLRLANVLPHYSILRRPAWQRPRWPRQAGMTVKSSMPSGKQKQRLHRSFHNQVKHGVRHRQHREACWINVVTPLTKLVRGAHRAIWIMSLGPPQQDSTGRAAPIANEQRILRRRLHCAPSAYVSINLVWHGVRIANLSELGDAKVIVVSRQSMVLSLQPARIGPDVQHAVVVATTCGIQLN